MNVGRRPWLARFLDVLAGPMSRWPCRLTLLSCGAIIWGAAWLPGARYLEFIGWAAVVAATVYTVARRFLRHSIRAYRRQPRLALPASEQFDCRQVLLVFLAMTTPLFWWPLRLNLLIHLPLLNRLAWHTYADRPMLNPPATPRMAGLFVITGIGVDTNFVSLRVYGGGEMTWRADNRRDYYYAYYPDDTPWFLYWNVWPRCGHWLVHPYRQHDANEAILRLLYRIHRALS
jgi:hypothetical protein